MRNDFYVYGYFEPGAEHPFYAGKGKGRRAYIHLQPAQLKKKSLFYNKLRKMLAAGIQPEIEIMVDNLSEQEAHQFEKDVIRVLGRRDLGTGRLCNLTDGGEGASGVQHSAESRRKMGDANRGKALSAETRRKLSYAKRGKTLSAEHRRKLSDSKRGRPIASRRTPVEAFDLNTGETVLRYESQGAVKRDGFHQSAVSRCMTGAKTQHKELGWRHATTSSLPSADCLSLSA